MANIDPDLCAAITAREEGRMDDALRLMKGLLARAGRSDPSLGPSEFIVTFEWSRLAAVYGPARDALASARDEQAALLLGGDQCYNIGNGGRPRSRFQVIVGINQILDDPRATYDLFVQVERLMPEHARRESRVALDAIVEAGDFALAERFMPDPMRWLSHLNQLARDLPLFAPPGSAPRLAAELMGFTKEVALRAAVLRGLDRGAEAEALRNAALAGVESEEMRALAERELAEPGTITRVTTDYRMALEAAANDG